MSGSGAFTVEAGASLSSTFRLFSLLFTKTWTTSFSPLFIETCMLSFFLPAGEGSTSPVSFSFPCRCSCSCSCPWLEGEFLLTRELPSFLFVFLLTTGGMSTSVARSSTRFGALARVVLDLDSWRNLTCSCSCSCSCSCARSEGVLSTCEGAVDALVILRPLLCREGEGSMSTAFAGSVLGPVTCAGAGAGTAGELITDVFRCWVVLVLVD